MYQFPLRPMGLMKHGSECNHEQRPQSPSTAHQDITINQKIAGKFLAHVRGQLRKPPTKVMVDAIGVEQTIIHQLCLATNTLILVPTQLVVEYCIILCFLVVVDESISIDLARIIPNDTNFKTSIYLELQQEKCPHYSGTLSHENPFLHCFSFLKQNMYSIYSILQNKKSYSSLLENNFFFYRICPYKVHVFPSGDVFQRSRIRNCFLFYRTRNCILQNKKERLVSLSHFEETLLRQKDFKFQQLCSCCATHLLNHTWERDFTFTSLIVPSTSIWQVI